MKALSKIAAGVSPSATLAVSALAKKMKAEGKDVIGFGAGEPDFATPDRISYAGVRAICDGKTRYTPAAGMIELRQAICDRVKADYGLEYEPTQAVVASGAKHMVYIALAALVDPGDEVIVPAFAFAAVAETVLLLGGGGFAFMQYQKKQREVAMKAAQRRAQQAFARTAHGALHHNAFCLAHCATSGRVSASSASSCRFSFSVRTAVRYQPALSPG